MSCTEVTHHFMQLAVEVSACRCMTGKPQYKYTTATKLSLTDSVLDFACLADEARPVSYLNSYSYP